MIVKNENEEIFNKISNNLKNNYLPIPYCVKNNELTITDKACYGIIP